MTADDRLLYGLALIALATLVERMCATADYGEVWAERATNFLEDCQAYLAQEEEDRDAGL